MRGKMVSSKVAITVAEVLYFRGGNSQVVHGPGFGLRSRSPVHGLRPPVHGSRSTVSGLRSRVHSPTVSSHSPRSTVRWSVRPTVDGGPLPRRSREHGRERSAPVARNRTADGHPGEPVTGRLEKRAGDAACNGVPAGPACCMILARQVLYRVQAYPPVTQCPAQFSGRGVP